MKIEYDHSKIEKDIQSKWNESNAFTAKIDNEDLIYEIIISN